MDVILLTKDQLTDTSRFKTFIDHLRRKLGVRKRPKSKTALRANPRLRECIFDDWGTYYIPQSDWEYQERLRAKRKVKC